MLNFRHTLWAPPQSCLYSYASGVVYMCVCFFVLVMFLKCATFSVVCKIWRKRGEAVQKRRGGVGGRVLFEIRPLYGKRKLGGLLKIQVDLQITSRVRLVVFVLHKLYHGCRPYDFCDSLALWKISPYRYSKGKKAQLDNKI